MSISPIGGQPALGPADPPKPADKSADVIFQPAFAPAVPLPPAPGESAQAATGVAKSAKGDPADKPGPVHVLAQETAGIDNLRLRIVRDQASGQFVYYGVDPTTGQVVRQYPPKDILDRIAYYRKAAGLAQHKS